MPMKFDCTAMMVGLEVHKDERKNESAQKMRAGRGVNIGINAHD